MEFPIPHKTLYFPNGSIANRVMTFEASPAQESLVFVPNWHGKPKHWHGFVEPLTRRFQLHYFETREKLGTLKTEPRICYRIESMASDLVNYLNHIQHPYHLMGTSIGGSTILKAWPYLQRKPQSLVLLCPVVNLSMPGYFHYFRYLSERTVRMVRPAVFFVMSRSKRTQKLSRSLYSAFQNKDLTDLLSMKYSIDDLLSMRMHASEITALDIPTFIGYTLNDGIHLLDDARILIEAIDEVEAAAFPNFRAVHQKHAANRVMTWYESRYPALVSKLAG